MNLDQKKAWLYRYQGSLHRQERLLSQLEEARSRATSIQTAPGGVHTAPTGTHSDRVADSVQRIDELQRKYTAEVEQGYQIYDEIQAAIEGVPSEVEQLILYYSFLRGKEAEEIALLVERDISRVYRLRSKAIKEFTVPEDTPENPKMC